MKLTNWITKRKLAIMGFSVLVGYAIVYIWASQTRSPTMQFLQLEDTRQLAYSYAHRGDPDAPTILLIHGAPADAFSWRKLQKLIPADYPYSILVVDRLGYGHTTQARENSLATHASAIHQLIQSENIKPLIVGHSYGGPVALRIAADFPASISGTILLAGATSPLMQDSQWFRQMVDGVGPLVPQAWANANAELLALTDENVNMVPRLESVTAPVTVIHGTWDPVCPHDMTVAYLMEALPQTTCLRIRTLQRAGHNLHLSQPEVLLAEIEAMLRG